MDGSPGQDLRCVWNVMKLRNHMFQGVPLLACLFFSLMTNCLSVNNLHCTFHTRKTCYIYQELHLVGV